MKLKGEFCDFYPAGTADYYCTLHLGNARWCAPSTGHLGNRLRSRLHIFNVMENEPFTFNMACEPILLPYYSVTIWLFGFCIILYFHFCNWLMEFSVLLGSRVPWAEMHRNVFKNECYSNLFLIISFFSPQIKEYEKLDSEEDRLCRSRQIYDKYIMKELLSCSHVSALRTGITVCIDNNSRYSLVVREEDWGPGDSVCLDHTRNRKGGSIQ